MDTSETHSPVQHYGTGGWSVLEHNPIEDVLTNDEDWDTGLRRLGWEEFSTTGHTHHDATGSPFAVLVYHRPQLLEDPQFLLEVSGNIGDHDEQVFVQDLPSLMRLLTSWAPVLQTPALAHAVAMSMQPVEMIEARSA